MRGDSPRRKNRGWLVRLANVPAETFEAAVEAEKPATVAKLADMGRHGGPHYQDWTKFPVKVERRPVRLVKRAAAACISGDRTNRAGAFGVSTARTWSTPA